MVKSKKVARGMFGIYTCISVMYIAWRAFFTLHIESGVLLLVLSATLLLVEASGLLHHWIRVKQALSLELTEKCTEIAIEEMEKCPDVDIVIMADKKSERDIFRTVNSCKWLRYPEEAKITITVIDTKRRSKIQVLSEQMGVLYLVHSGTYGDCMNHVCEQTQSEYIALFEAGTIPQHDFLLHTVSRFQKEDRVGFVQTAIGSFNPDSYQFRLFSEKKITEEKRYFQAIHQPAAAMCNAVVLEASSVIFSRKALSDIGGFATGRLLTGIRIQEKNYKGLYIDHIFSSGIYETDLKSYLQKKREQIGEIAELLGRKTGLNGRQKICYRAYKGEQLGQLRTLLALVLPMIGACMGVSLWKCNWMSLLGAWILLSASAEACFCLVSVNTTNMRWRKLYKVSTSPFLLASLVEAKLGFRRKERSNNRIWNMFYFLFPHTVLLLLSLCGIVNGIRMMLSGSCDATMIPLLLVLVNHMYYLMMSLFWAVGRPYVRQEDRIATDIPCKINGSGHEVVGQIRDLSPRSISVRLDIPYDLDDEDEYVISISTEYYEAEIVCNIVGVQYEEEKWKYVFSLNEENSTIPSYYGILYDRQPAMQKEMAKEASRIADIHRNIGRRFRYKTLQYRKLPRIPINQDLALTGSSETVFVKNYNYKYIIIHSKEKPLEYMELEPKAGFQLKCEKFHKFGEHMYLYKVLNYDEIHADMVIRKIQYEWVQECIQQNNLQSHSDYMKEEKNMTYM